MWDHLIAIIVIMIVLFFALRGYRKGFLGLIYGVFTWIFMIIFVAVGSPIIEDALETSSVHDAVYEKVEEKVRQKIDEKVPLIDLSEETGKILPSVIDNGIKATAISIDSIKQYIESQSGITFDEAEEAIKNETGFSTEDIPDISLSDIPTEDIYNSLDDLDMSDIAGILGGLSEDEGSGNSEGGSEEGGLNLIGELAQLIEEAKTGMESEIKGQINSVIASITEEITGHILHIIAIALAVILSLVICSFIRIILEWVHELPVFGTLGNIAGLAWGLLEGILVVWLLFAIFAAFGDSETGLSGFSEINESGIMLWLYQHNPILAVITGMTNH